MQRTYNLGAFVWGGLAGLVTIPLKPLPDSYANDVYAVACITCEAHLNVTTGAGGGFTRREMMEWISQIFLKSGGHLFVSGMSAYNFIEGIERLDHGEPLDSNLADVPVSTTTDLRIVFHIEFEIHDDGMDTTDGLVPAGFFNDAQLQMHLGGPAPNANTTVNSAVVNVHAELHRVSELNIVKLPTYQVVRALLQDQLPMGIYTALGIQAPSGGFTAAANLTNIQMKSDGELIHSNMDPNQVIRAFERNKEDRTDPTGCTSWTHDYANCLIYPLIWNTRSPSSNRARFAIDTGNQQLNMDSQGNLSYVDYVMRYYSVKRGSDAERYLATLDVRNPDDVLIKFKTASKQPLGDDEAAQAPGLSMIPAKVIGTQTGNRSSLGKYYNILKRTV